MKKTFYVYYHEPKGYSEEVYRWSVHDISTGKRYYGPTLEVAIKQNFPIKYTAMKMAEDTAGKKRRIFIPSLKWNVEFNLLNAILAKYELHKFWWETPGSPCFYTHSELKSFEEVKEEAKHLDFNKEAKCGDILLVEVEIKVTDVTFASARTRNEWEKIVKNHYKWLDIEAKEYLYKNPW